MLSPHLRAALTVLSAVVGIAARANVQAEQVDYTQLDARLARLESQLASQGGVRTAAYQESYYPPPVFSEAPVLEEVPATADCGSSSCSDDTCACQSAGWWDYCNSCCGGCNVYGDVQFTFMRAHVLEGGIGAANSKLAEEYEFSPRLIVGLEGGAGNGIRTRYWHYGHQLDDINNPGAGYRFEFSVFDLEAYHHIRGCRTDFTIGGGFRAARAGIEYAAEWNDVTALGLTLSLDAETRICHCGCHHWSVVYGGRISLLGGDWSGSGGAAIPTNRDDNLTVTELNFAVEHGCRVCCLDAYWRLGVELQNWRSDNLASGTNTDSIGFVGPSVQFGASF